MNQKYSAIAICIFSICATASAQTIPAHVHKTLNRLIGTWEVQTRIGNRVAIENATFEWTVGQSAVLYQGKGESFPATGKKVSFMGVLGWDAINQVIKEYGFDTGGGTFVATHRISKESWTDNSESITLVEGKRASTKYKRTFTFQSDRAWTIEYRDLSLDGESRSTFKSIFRRSDSVQAKDLAAVQGRWHRKQAMKEIKGNVSVLYRYDKDGKVVHSHRTVFRLSRRGDIKVYTGIQSEVLVGKDRGRKIDRPFSFIYRVNDKEWAETHGFLPGNEAAVNEGPVFSASWSRTKPEAN